MLVQCKQDSLSSEDFGSADYCTDSKKKYKNRFGKSFSVFIYNVQRITVTILLQTLSGWHGT